MVKVTPDVLGWVLAGVCEELTGVLGYMMGEEMAGVSG